MTIIFPSPIFGPIHSRRLGVSLGINLLPDDGKVCSFDCIYCECGFNAEHRTKKLLPTREEVRMALEEKLKDMQANGPAPDVLTFAGNGEPTAHPHFPEIIEDTLALRDRYFPKAKVSVLSNSTFIDRPVVFEALNKIDNNILKLDTVDEEYIHLLDRPNGKYSVKKIIERMKEFKGNCIVQTMFLKGGYQGTDMDNTSDKYGVTQYAYFCFWEILVAKRKCIFYDFREMGMRSRFTVSGKCQYIGSRAVCLHVF